ncbi:MAG: redoxin family protein [Cytophagales bacterium]|nr:redoxin family protein [Cytophagales bacterium]MDW8383191.1 redoxin family protein [Flammeovirgaceae bacterium]
MRHFLFLFSCVCIVVFGIISCQKVTDCAPPQQHQDGAISISVCGEYKSGQNVTLYKLIEGGREEVAQTKTDDGGNFSLRVKVKEPDFYLVKLGSVEQTLFLRNTNVFLKFSSNDSLQIEGSPDTEIYLAFRSLEKELEKQYEEIRNAYYEGKKNESQADADYKVFKEELNRKVFSFVKQYDTSLIVILALQLLDLDEKASEAYAYAEKLAKLYPNSTVAASFKNRLARMKQLDIGQIPPDISLPAPDGKQIALSSLRGKVVLIDFWASWCTPCRQEAPYVVEAYKKYKNKGFEIYGVSLDRDKESWLQAIREDKMTWLHVSDLKFWNSAVVELYNLQGIPQTILLDREGKIIAKNLRGKALEAKLKEIL